MTAPLERAPEPAVKRVALHGAAWPRALADALRDQAAPAPRDELLAYLATQHRFAAQRLLPRELDLVALLLQAWADAADAQADKGEEPDAAHLPALLWDAIAEPALRGIEEAARKRAAGDEAGLAVRVVCTLLARRCRVNVYLHPLLAALVARAFEPPEHDAGSAPARKPTPEPPRALEQALRWATTAERDVDMRAAARVMPLVKIATHTTPLTGARGLTTEAGARRTRTSSSKDRLNSCDCEIKKGTPAAPSRAFAW
jgi:hypothetical protein